VTDDAKRAGALEAERLGPVLDADVLERVARILRHYATNAGPKQTRRSPKTGDVTSDASAE
jgi:hypothetical protein